MKKSFSFLKTLSFLFGFLFVNSIYSQSTCGAGYAINISGNTTTCTYTFTATTPMSPTVSGITWTISSHYPPNSSQCYTGSGTPYSVQFCFDGFYDIDMQVFFSGGGSCHVRQLNVHISCTYAPTCDPDITTFTIPDPVVEVTYLGTTAQCPASSPSQVPGCMYDLTGACGSNYCASCGWTWAIRIPPTGYNCDFWEYYVEYMKVNNCGSYTCTTDLLTIPGTVYCIDAQMGQPIFVVATTVYTNCCVPGGYQRGYYWTPTFGGSPTPIGPPTITGSVCDAYRTCGNTDACSENQIQMVQTSGWSNPHCLVGGKKVEQRDQVLIDENANTEQNVIIYTVNGGEVFNGKWKFGDPKSSNLNWPKNITPGIYFVKFLNSPSKEPIKLFKLN